MLTVIDVVDDDIGGAAILENFEESFRKFREIKFPEMFGSFH